MLAVVTLRSGGSGRHYRLPAERDYEAVRKAQARVAKLLAEWERGGKQGLCPVPDEPTPAGGGSGAGRAFSVQRYGMLQWGDLFTARQKVALHTLAKLSNQAGPAALDARVLAHGRDVSLPGERAPQKFRPRSAEGSRAKEPGSTPPRRLPRKLRA